MNQYEMVVLIVAIIGVAGIFKAKYGAGRRGRDTVSQVDDAENERLRDEVRALKDRLAVLERITVEKENSLDREIERLRDK